MNAPNSSSNALSAREANGLVEGNGVSVSSAIEQIPSYLFFTSDVPCARNGFESLKTYRPFKLRLGCEYVQGVARGRRNGRAVGRKSETISANGARMEAKFFSHRTFGQ